MHRLHYVAISVLSKYKCGMPFSMPFGSFLPFFLSQIIFFPLHMVYNPLSFFVELEVSILRVFLFFFLKNCHMKDTVFLLILNVFLLSAFDLKLLKQHDFLYKKGTVEGGVL